MKKLFKDKKGFTLMEMLIVVAIIVILVAVSIPVFTSQLEKAKKAADDANFRAAKAEAVTMYLTDDDAFTAGNVYYYDATNGKLSSTTIAKGYGQSSEHEKKIIYVIVDSTGNVTMDWITENTTRTP